MCQEIFNGVLRVFQVPKMLQGSLKSVPRKFLGYFKKVLRVFRGRLKDVSRDFSVGFKGI